MNELTHPIVSGHSGGFSAHQTVDGSPPHPTSCLGAFNSCFAVYHFCIGKDLSWAVNFLSLKEVAIGRQCVDLFLLTTPSAKTVCQHVFIYFCTDKKLKKQAMIKMFCSYNGICFCTSATFCSLTMGCPSLIFLGARGSLTSLVGCICLGYFGFELALQLSGHRKLWVTKCLI